MILSLCKETSLESNKVLLFENVLYEVNTFRNNLLLFN